MEKEKVIERLKELTGKSKIILTKRGNKAIKFSMKALKAIGRKKVLIQDQGGWITYTQYAEELKMEIVKLKTDSGVVDVEDLKKNIDSSSVLLINSMPGYFVYENMEKIAEIVKAANAILINDNSGSIGTEEGKIGDIIVGSFGEWKPVDLGYGGFIATDSDIFGDMESIFEERFAGKLLEKLDNLNSRVAYLKSLAKKIKSDLKDFDIVHRDAEGFDVIVKFSTEAEKEKVLNYCAKNSLEYTLCPRYIRVNQSAVCIEVKRRQENGIEGTEFDE